jgi:hypothetical protein
MEFLSDHKIEQILKKLRELEERVERVIALEHRILKHLSVVEVKSFDIKQN